MGAMSDHADIARSEASLLDGSPAAELAVDTSVVLIGAALLIPWCAHTVARGTCAGAAPFDQFLERLWPLWHRCVLVHNGVAKLGCRKPCTPTSVRFTGFWPQPVFGNSSRRLLTARARRCAESGTGRCSTSSGFVQWGVLTVGVSQQRSLAGEPRVTGMLPKPRRFTCGPGQGPLVSSMSRNRSNKARSAITASIRARLAPRQP